MGYDNWEQGQPSSDSQQNNGPVYDEAIIKNSGFWSAVTSSSMNRCVCQTTKGSLPSSAPSTSPLPTQSLAPSNAPSVSIACEEEGFEMHGGRCISFFDALTWDACDTICGAYQANMLCVDDQERNDYILSLIQGDTWIGFAKTTGWAWPGNCDSTYENWGYGTRLGDTQAYITSDWGLWGSSSSSDNKQANCACEYKPYIEGNPTPLPTQACLPGQYHHEGICRPCARGMFSDVPGAKQCTVCGIGTVAPNSGSVTCELCPNVPNATYNGDSSRRYAELHDSLDDCLPCIMGSISSANRGYCTKCEAGTEEVNGQCSQCKLGQFSSRAGDRCLDCPYGSISSDDRSQCIKCEPGTEEGENFACVQCTAGRFNPRAGDPCVDCGLGKFQSLNGSATCSPCPPPMFTGGEGAISCDACNQDSYYHDGECISCVSEAATKTGLDMAFCAGGTTLPAPTVGHWSDRSAAAADWHRKSGGKGHVAGIIYPCVRGTCSGAVADSMRSCWEPIAIGNSTLKKCEQNAMLCDEGATGPLCGVCINSALEGRYIFKASSQSCELCDTDSTMINNLIIGSIATIFVVSVLAMLRGLGFLYIPQSWVDYSEWMVGLIDWGKLVSEGCIFGPTKANTPTPQHPILRQQPKLRQHPTNVSARVLGFDADPQHCAPRSWYYVPRACALVLRPHGRALCAQPTNLGLCRMRKR
mmetsp:Transcript_73640/g.209785  ORF Transcript_73640/g.209785 Transcript_73640/m.209785 type:complete len:699 (+) Transcript_73640:391-2487(+)